MIKILGYNPLSIPGYQTPPEMNFSYIKFSGGEIHVTVPLTSDDDFSRPSILADIHNSDDLMELLMVTDAIKRSGNTYGIDLILPYVPYGRQDRVANPGESLSIKVFCDIINAQKYDTVEILDPHSDVTSALLDRCIVRPQENLVFEMLSKLVVKAPVGDYPPFYPALELHDIILVSPDAGASKKTLKVAQKCGFKGVIRADKVRDTKTGNITGTEVYCSHLGKQDVLIVDDLIDGGRTFEELAKVLRTKTTGRVMLYVTHGIFSHGYKVCGNFDHTYVYKDFHERAFGPDTKKHNLTIHNFKGEY